jgi:hypothetical protein
MTEAEMQAQLAEANRKTAEAVARADKAEADRVAAAKLADDTVAAARKAKIGEHRAKITGKFHEAVTAGRIEPKVREQFAGLTRYETDDDSCERVTIEQVDAYIDSVGKPAKASRKPGTGGGTGGGGAGDEADYSDLNPAEELKAKTFRYCRETNQDPNKYDVYLRASQQILRDDKDLAERYKYMPLDATRSSGKK